MKTKYEILDAPFNRDNYPDLIGQVVDSPPPHAHVKLVKVRESLDEIFENATLTFPTDFIKKCISEGYQQKEIIDALGNIVAFGSHDATADVKLFLDELDDWFFEVVGRNARKFKGTHTVLEDFFQSLAGIGIPHAEAKDAYARLGLGSEPSKLTDADVRRLSKLLRERTKPFLIAANKCDSGYAQGNIESLRNAYPETQVIPVFADYELALQRAKTSGIVEYDGKKITLTAKGAQNERAVEAIKKIGTAVAAYGSTGVQEAIDRAVFGLARQVVVFPVEDETHYSNHFGKVLPDAILLKQGSTPVDLAGAIHADLASHFLYAVDCEKKTRIGKDHRLATGEVIKVVATK